MSAASRLLSNNSALVVGAADAPTKAEVEAEADTLSLRMCTAFANARRLVPGSPAVGGAGSPSSARGGASGDSLAILGPLVGHLVEALRVGVEMYAQVVSMRSLCVSHANRVRITSSVLCGLMRCPPTRRSPSTSKLVRAVVGWLGVRIAFFSLALRLCVACGSLALLVSSFFFFGLGCPD